MPSIAAIPPLVKRSFTRSPGTTPPVPPTYSQGSRKRRFAVRSPAAPAPRLLVGPYLTAPRSPTWDRSPHGPISRPPDRLHI